MSTSDFYVLNKKSTRHYAEFHNGWGSAPILWDYLGEKYIEEKPVYSFDMSHMRKVWALSSDERLSTEERVCLLMTFDRSYIALSDLGRVADCCTNVGEMVEDGVRANHWGAFGNTLREASNEKFSRFARGIALSCTSVSDMWIKPSDDYLENAWPIGVEF